MYKHILYTHTLFVFLYLLQLFIKLVLVAAKKEEALEKFQKKTKVAHIILASLMVVTGIYLFTTSVPPVYAELYIWIKIGLVIISIPLGIIGVKKRNALLTGLSFLILVAVVIIAYANDPRIVTDENTITKELTELKEVNETATVQLTESELAGKAIYNQYCMLCHGEDGKLGKQGAKDITATQLSDEEIKTLIRNGKGLMPAYPDLSDEDIEQVIAYTKTIQ